MSFAELFLFHLQIIKRMNLNKTVYEPMHYLNNDNWCTGIIQPPSYILHTITMEWCCAPPHALVKDDLWGGGGEGKACTEVWINVDLVVKIKLGY